MKRPLICLLGFMLSGPASAGVGEAKMIAQLQAIYTSTVEQLQQIKDQSETMNQVKSGLNYSVESYYDIKNFSLDRIVSRIQSDIEGLTELDNLAGKTMEQRILIVQRELRRRIDDPDISADERERLEQEDEMLESIRLRSEILTEMNANAVGNMAEASNDLGTKDSGRISAEGISTLVQLETQRELERNEIKRAQIQDQQVMYNLNQQTRKIVEATETDGW